MTVGAVALRSRAVVRQYLGHRRRSTVAFEDLLQQGNQFAEGQRRGGGLGHEGAPIELFLSGCNVKANYPVVTVICQLLT